jgi:hypothetical protein
MRVMARKPLRPQAASPTGHSGVEPSTEADSQVRNNHAKADKPVHRDTSDLNTRSQNNSAILQTSPRRLNRLAAALGCRSYLEIGVEMGQTLLQVRVEQRTGVDPQFKFDWEKHHGRDGMQLHACSSDHFFASLDPEVRYDLIFIDGLHTFEQTYRDIVHALRHSHPRTALLIDDTVPSDVFSSCRDQDQCLDLRAQFGNPNDNSWHGDTYKVVPLLCAFHCDLRLLTLKDGGNPQTLLWRPSRPLDEDALRTLQAMWAVQNLAAADYLWFLENTSLYNPVSEEEGLQAVIDDLGAANAT